MVCLSERLFNTEDLSFAGWRNVSTKPQGPQERRKTHYNYLVVAKEFSLEYPNG